MAERGAISLRARWAALGIVLLVALLIGSGVFSPPRPSPTARAASLEARLKCPSCTGLSVAQSTSPSSLAVRSEVRKGIKAGRSDDEIIAELRSRYGNAVLLTPPPGPLSDLLWAIPLALGLAGLVAIVMAARRRSLNAPRSQPEARGRR